MKSTRSRLNPIPASRRCHGRGFQPLHFGGPLQGSSIEGHAISPRRRAGPAGGGGARAGGGGGGGAAQPGAVGKAHVIIALRRVLEGEVG